MYTCNYRAPFSWTYFLPDLLIWHLYCTGYCLIYHILVIRCMLGIFLQLAFLPVILFIFIKFPINNDLKAVIIFTVFGIRIMCPSGATCLPADCCFSELTLKKSNPACWSRTKWTSSSSHWKLTWLYTTITHSLFVVLSPLIIAPYVIPFTASDYPFYMFKLFFSKYHY